MRCYLPNSGFQVEAVRRNILSTVRSRSQTQVRAELPCVTGGQQGSNLQHACTAFCEDLPCQLEPALLIYFFFFYGSGFLLCHHPCFSVIVEVATCTSHTVFSPVILKLHQGTSPAVVYPDPWIRLQWVPNTHPAVYWFLNNSESLVLTQTLFCLGQALFLVGLIFTLKCLINTLLKEVEKNPLKHLQVLSTHTVPMQ